MAPDQIQQQIDDLLRRYLILLDQYTQLREQLSRLQSSTFQDIARANFSAPRGQRFGQDQYDERMQASRRVVIGGEPSECYFCVVKGTDEDGGDDGDERQGGDERPGHKAADPLRWFGILAPASLRAAQGHAVEAVEKVIPRLVSIMAEMKHVEIEVRRARKRRAKAEGAAARKDRT